MEEKQEIMRRLIELAVQYGRKRQNPQTGYIHYYYGNSEDEAHYSIPTVENFLFCLALFRSRSLENINEAKIIVDNLLHFQNIDPQLESFGNFPIYLHEYPACKDRFTTVQVAFVLIWIHRWFHNILGQELKDRMENALRNSITSMLNTHKERNVPYFLSVKIAAAAKAGGELLKDDFLIAEGSKLLDLLNNTPNFSCWYCPANLSATLQGLALAYTNISSCPWAQFWQYIKDSWHHPTCSYAGPALKEFQSGFEPQVTSYDLFLGYFTGHFSARALRESIVHLEAVLIPPSTDHFESPTYPHTSTGHLGESQWTFVHTDSKAYSLFSSKGISLNPLQQKGFHILRILLGNHSQTNSFVCQWNPNHNVTCDFDKEKIILTFELGNPSVEEDRESNREIAFCVNSSANLKFLADNKASSTFQPGETLTLISDAFAIEFMFTIIKGQGTFMGHRMLGNRPAQLNNKGSHRYDAYDWLYFLRTVRRSSDCMIQCEIKI